MVEDLLQQVQFPSSNFRSQPIGMYASFSRLCGPVHQDVLCLVVDAVQNLEDEKEKQGELLIQANFRIQRLRMNYLTEIFQQALYSESLFLTKKNILSPTRHHFLLWKNSIKTSGDKTNNLSVQSRLIKILAKRYNSSTLSVLQHWQIVCRISQKTQSMIKQSGCARHRSVFSAVWNVFQSNLLMTAILLSWGKFSSRMVLKAGKTKLRREAGIRMYQFGMLNTMRARLQKKLTCLHALKCWQCVSAH
jgi:hypothetical protein